MKILSLILTSFAIAAVSSSQASQNCSMTEKFVGSFEYAPKGLYIRAVAVARDSDKLTVDFCDEADYEASKGKICTKVVDTRTYRCELANGTETFIYGESGYGERFTLASEGKTLVREGMGEREEWMRTEF